MDLTSPAPHPDRLRASSLPLLTKCSGSAHLPQLATTSENAVKGAQWGTMAHNWKETGVVRGPNARTEAAFARAVELSGISRADLWPDGGWHEQSVALRVDGIREVRGTKPDPPDGRFITGTDDFHWYLFGGELWVDDLKTGKYYEDDRGNQLYAQDVRSTQLRFYALAIVALLGYVGPVHVSLTHWPRLPVARRHLPPARLWTTYTSNELHAFWGELEALLLDVASGELRPGDHCRFCPSRDYCLMAQPVPETRKWR